MYNLLKIHQDVEFISVSLLESSILFKNGQLFLNGSKLENYDYYNWLNNETVQFGKNAQNYVINKTKIIQVPKPLNKIGFSQEEAFYIDNFRFDTNDRKSKFELKKINFSNNEVYTILESFTGSFVSYNSYNDNILVIDNNILKSFSIVSREYTWQTNLEQFDEIVDFVGVVENILWIWLSNDRLIGIDINNGEISNNYKPLQKISQIVEGFVFLKHFIEKEQCLYFFHRYYLIQVNLKELTTNLLWKNQDYNIGLSFFTDDFIYFIGGKNQGVFKNGIGVFCRKTNQVIWETTFELADYVVLKDIQFGNNNIYVLNTAGDLRIFEKEV